MKIRFIEDTDLGTIESTVNMLLSQGWEKHDRINILPNGKYFLEMTYYGRAPQIEREYGTAVGRGYENRVVGEVGPATAELEIAYAGQAIPTVEDR